MLGLTTGGLIVLVVTLLLGFYMAWTIGANDVSNSMGTVFGSGRLSLKKIILIAAIFEFLGAFLLGAHVTSTLKGGIVDPVYFQEEHFATGVNGINIFVAGMMAVLLAASLWVTLATYKSLPISTSQSIVGAVAGFGLTAVILGDIPLKAMSGGTLLEISIGWALSPILGGVLSFLIFLFIRKAIFNADNPEDRAQTLITFFTALVFFILILTGISGGLKNLRDALEHVLPLTVVDTFFEHFWLRILVVGILSIILGYLGGIYFRRSKRYRKLKSVDRVESMFGGLLILTACYVAFAHGANDVANAVGPIAAISQVIMKNEISCDVSIPVWVLVLGGVGIVVGVSTWGYRVMHTIGKKITNITPSRGFAASFGAASSVLACSFLGIPVSTSQIIVGAVIGVGLAGGITAIDLRVIRNILISWVFTIPVAAFTTAILFLIFRGVALNL
ncbi:MAG: inorganic phosphate transporter [Candidatus Thermoplasmatota archaeon]|nr:inorganic phosphate transporter [Candidatus Thermoplasmatota archaeon]